MSAWHITVPVLTSAHLTLATSMKLVNNLIDDAVVAPYDAGMFLWVGADPIPEGLPLDLQGLLMWGQSLGYEWVRLDSCGCEFGDLALYKDTWS